MKYMGSKNRIAKSIIPLMVKDRKPGQWWIEPFCGGCNLIDKIGGPRIANDSHFFLIELLRAVQSGVELPDYIDLETYKKAQGDKTSMPPWLIGFIGFCCSYSGKWFGGFARNVAAGKPDSEILNKTSRNYCAESKRNLLKQAPFLQGVIFQNQQYFNLEIPANSIIYCDPPYAGTTKYKDGFNHAFFWDWCRSKHEQRHQVFISEYSAPSDFECIFEKKINSSLTKNTGGKQGTERLFIPK